MSQNGRRDPKSHQRHTDQDRARRGLPATVSQHYAHDQRLGQGMTGVTGHCVLPLCPRPAARSRPRHCTPGPRQSRGSCLPRPPTAVQASAPTRPQPRAQSVHRGLHVRRHVCSETLPGLPRRTGSDVTTTPPLYSQDGLLRRPRRHRNRPQGSDMPPLLARCHTVIHVLSLPSLQL